MTSPITYIEKVPEDADGKRFGSVLADNGAGSNEFVATQGGTPVTQNGELVAPTEVSSGQLLTELGSLLTALGTLATEATAGTLATEATVGTLATDTNLLALIAKLPTLVDGRTPVVESGDLSNYFVPLAANGHFATANAPMSLRGILVVTSGTVTIKDATTTIPIVTAMPVSAGQSLTFPKIYSVQGLDITFASGASGTILYQII